MHYIKYYDLYKIAILLPSIYMFCIGLFGIIYKRSNIISVLISIEIMLLGVSFLLVGFANFFKDLDAQIFVLFVLTVAAAKAAIGLAITIKYYNNKGSIDIQTVAALKG